MEAEAMSVNAEGANTFKINNFEGPLDLLLFLIKKNTVGVFENRLKIRVRVCQFFAPVLAFDKVINHTRT